jgi:hypothetical protein
LRALSAEHAEESAIILDLDLRADVDDDFDLAFPGAAWRSSAQLGVSLHCA